MTKDIWNTLDMYETCEIKANIHLRFLIQNICKQLTFHLQYVKMSMPAQGPYSKFW